MRQLLVSAPWYKIVYPYFKSTCEGTLPASQANEIPYLRVTEIWTRSWWRPLLTGTTASPMSFPVWELEHARLVTTAITHTYLQNTIGISTFVTKSMNDTGISVAARVDLKFSSFVSSRGNSPVSCSTLSPLIALCECYRVLRDAME